MKKMILIFASICLSVSVWAFAADGVIVVDKKDVKVELTSIETQEISLYVGGFSFTIPITNISSIHLAEDEKTLILVTVAGKELRGTSYLELEGTWEIGKYSIALSDIKSVDFGRAILPQEEVAGEVRIVNKSDVKIELTGMETKEISLQVGEFEQSIFVAEISSIRRSEDGKWLVLDTIKGGELKGTSDSKLEGMSEIGKCYGLFWDIKLIDFGRDIQPQQGTADQPDGFFAICTDRTGTTMELFGFSYIFDCYSRAGYFLGGEWYNNNIRTFLPFEHNEVAIGIPFTDIATIKFADNQPKESIPRREWQPALSIELQDDNTLTGRLAKWGQGTFGKMEVDAGYRRGFAGKTESADLYLPFGKVHQIIFDHKRDKDAPRVTPGKDNIEGDLDSAYTISVKTWQGNQITLQNGCQFRMQDNGYKWRELKTEFEVGIGESTNIISFDKIRSVQFQKKGKPEAQLTTISGKTIEVSLALDYESYSPACLGGNMGEFGPARIEMSKVASFEISGVKP